ncbi:MAG: GAF domain-containing protein [Lachnospiraceae bacterium]|nr:GAF domain-containing protein [Lachnospiraceae bacterium]
MNNKLLLESLNALLDNEPDFIVAMANTSAFIFNEIKNLNWAGFYRVVDGNLVLGPFQGKVACTRIKKGNGVCGTALKENQTILVKNVHEFPGHIACDSASNSEIVVPVKNKSGECIAVLDIDSPLLERFGEEEKEFFEGVVKILEVNL